MGALIALAAAFIVWLFLTRRSQTAQGTTPETDSSPGFDFTAPLSGATGSAIAMSNSTNPLDQLAQAIGRQEGYGIPGALPTRDNNPGDLTKVGGGFQQFASPADGFAALYSWLTRHIGAHPDWTFRDLFNFYLRGSTTAPPVDDQGDSNIYAQNVAGWLGVSPDSTVSSFLGTQGSAPDAAS